MCSEDLIIRKLSAEKVVIMVVEVNYSAVCWCNARCVLLRVSVECRNVWAGQTGVAL